MATGNSQRVTIRTVAADAGVSVAAVSKVLRDAYGVSPGLRSKVEASVAKLGYRPRPAARAMRGQSSTIGFLLPDIRNAFFPDILDGVNAALERTRYEVLLAIGRSASIEATLIETMIDWGLDGVVPVAPRLEPSDARAMAERIPMVIIGHHEADATQFDTVNNDDDAGAALVVNHLADGDRTRIAMLSLELPDLGGIVVTSHREVGYRRAMIARGLGAEVNIVKAEQTACEVQNTARRLLQSADRPDAIFCWTDFVAFEVLSVATEIGLAVPDELAVVGYDNTSQCDLAQNSLTSVDRSGQVLGLQSARLVIERIKGRDKAEHFVVGPRLVVRGSSGNHVLP